MEINFESKGDFNNAELWLKRIAQSTSPKVLSQIASEGERNLSANTPKDTGETSSGWRSKVTTKGSVSEISWTNDAHPELGVNLAKLIDLGHGTGTGGYVPPKPYIKQSMDSVFQTAGDRIAKELIE